MTHLPAVHHRLRMILTPFTSELVATRDGPGALSLEMPGLEGKPRGYVAGTRVGKRYVSFYLMGVYGSPELRVGISDGMRRRMQGKACFNFTRIEEPLFEELADLSARAIPRFVESARNRDP
jgi:hypothetical protein